MKNLKRTHLKQQDFSFKDIIIRSCFFIFMFCVASIACLIILSYFFYNSNDPSKWAKIVSLCSLYFCVFTTSLIQSKVNRQRYLLCSIILGVGILILTFLYTLFFGASIDFSTTNLIWRLLIPVISILGGMLGIKKQKRAIHRRKK